MTEDYFTVYEKVIDPFSSLGLLRNYDPPKIEPVVPTYSRLNNLEEKKDALKSWFNFKLPQSSSIISGEGISDNMLDQLLKQEGKHSTSDGKLVAKAGKQFGESFVTGPYGMVYKHIDENGNLLSKPVAFKAGETVSEEWARKNARAYYNKTAQEWKDTLKGENISQDELDALVSASGGTAKSKQALKEFVISHWDDKKAISDYLRNFATTAAGNHKRMPGLVLRRQQEADWFLGDKRDSTEYLKNRKLYNV